MTLPLEAVNTSVDEVLLALADERRRLVVEYFREAADRTVSCDELAAYVHANRTGSHRGDAVETRLHHVDLPKLADAGLIKYDGRNNTVRYQPLRSVEAIVDAIEELEGK